jgi:hypothetical protein
MEHNHFKQKAIEGGRIQIGVKVDTDIYGWVEAHRGQYNKSCSGYATLCIEFAKANEQAFLEFCQMKLEDDALKMKNDAIEIAKQKQAKLAQAKKEQNKKQQENKKK